MRLRGVSTAIYVVVLSLASAASVTVQRPALSTSSLRRLSLAAKRAQLHRSSQSEIRAPSRVMTSLSDASALHMKEQRDGSMSGLRLALDKVKSTTRSLVVRSSATISPSPSTAVMAGPPQATRMAKLRAIFFYLLTGIVAIPLFVVMLAIAPVVLTLDPYRRAGEHNVNAFWAAASTNPLYKTEVIGLENLPGPKEPCVYVANHQSYLDIYTLLTKLPRPFKFVSKTSNFLIPIVGWSMWITGHVGLDRMDRKSQIRLINDCRKLLENGAQVLLFPEGTRTTTWTEGHPVMGEFKKGAFSIAKKAGVPIVPISLVGTGKLMPNGKEGLLFPGETKMVIHPRIETTGRDANDLLKESRAAIASALPAGSH